MIIAQEHSAVSTRPSPRFLDGAEPGGGLKG